MAGHSHWAGIKHKKAVIDAKRGKIWSKLSKAIILAARDGGDPSMNLRLRYAINDAKAVSMPKDNIERAIKKGTGELDGGNIDEVLYEGYGPGGVAILCDILTDNRNRTAPEVRKIFERSGGKLGSTGCVNYMFTRKGMIAIPSSQINEDALMELTLEAGADDIKKIGENYQVTCAPEDLVILSEVIQTAKLETLSREIIRIPSDMVDIDAPEARKVLRIMERLEDHDDVQSVASNFNIPEDIMAILEADEPSGR